MADAGLTDPLDELIDELIERPEANAKVGALWVRRHAARGDWKCEDRLPPLQARGAVGREATCAFVEVLAEARRAVPLRRYIEKHGSTLRQETPTWASVGYGLLTVGDYSRTALWLADWRSRADLQPWMLIPLAVALRGAGRDDEAAEASRHALGLEDQDARSGCHSVWLATDELLTGRAEAATNHLATTDPSGLNPYYQSLYALVQVTIELQPMDATERGQAFAPIRERLRAAPPEPVDWSCPAFRRTHRRLVQRLARDVGGISAMLWAGWQIVAGELRGGLRV